VIYKTKFSDITYLPRITKLHPETQLPRHHALRYFPQCIIQYGQPCRFEIAIHSTYTDTFFVVNTYRIIRFKEKFQSLGGSVNSTKIKMYTLQLAVDW